ncbi:1-(5-phosphoribosyl)-5-[(5-phosphoribosylamino)methylideneamino]imidazole-4-carboxamide isomerase [Liberiplasma polymorphum]|uniref:1-(5-phosphoribosyl)-5-[(5- phosphoribosylamino)methylideneamino]imidazole-4- carboxamide isomerase n=1 Tax=Liberiplasma polymorphum TaxID=3374570 RepID=UPI00377413C3
MILFPAIDIKNKQCVRLKQGKFDDVTVYESNPVIVAKKFETLGAQYLHIIDLDGAQSGENSNIDVIKEIVNQVNIPVQVGGGIRSINRVETLLSIGVTRVIIGTMAIENLDLLKRLVDKYAEKIVVSLDAKDGFITTEGWQTTTKVKTLSLCKKLETIGVKTIVYTDIAKDGMLIGPNFEDYITLKNNTSLNIIASGGVSSLEDLKDLSKINLYGVISGKAIYEKRFTVEEALACLQKESSLV